MKFRIKWNKERKDVDVDPAAGVVALKQAVNDAFGTLAFRFALAGWHPIALSHRSAKRGTKTHLKGMEGCFEGH